MRCSTCFGGRATRPTPVHRSFRLASRRASSASRTASVSLEFDDRHAGRAIAPVRDWPPAPTARTSLAHEGLRRLHRRGDGTRGRAASTSSDGGSASAAPAGGRRAAAVRSICGVSCLAARSLRFGELVDLPRRQRVDKPRPIVVLADVSGSMERYSRMLLQFVYGVTRGSHRVESFVFATRLTRVTRAARRSEPRPLGDAADAVGAGLGRRHAHRRCAADLQRALGAPDHPQRSCRSCSFPTGGTAATPPCSRASSPASAQQPPLDLAESPAWLGELRAPDPRHAGGAAAGRRLPAGT